MTARVGRVIDLETNRPLVDLVLDKAGQKGTGRWTAQVALDLAVPVPTIAAAIDARVLSSFKEERVAAAAHFPVEGRRDSSRSQGLIDDAASALHASRIWAYAQGMALIRAGFAGVRLEHRTLRDRKNLDGRLHYSRAPSQSDSPGVRGGSRAAQSSHRTRGRADARGGRDGWRRTVRQAIDAGIPMPAHSSALAYFDSHTTARLPQNLTQASATRSALTLTSESTGRARFTVSGSALPIRDGVSGREAQK